MNFAFEDLSLAAVESFFEMLAKKCVKEANTLSGL